MEMDSDKRPIEVEHHKQLELCQTRPAYRQGRKLTAVKTYTISSESQHLFVYGVPKINLRNELKKLCSNYGQIITMVPMENYKTEMFTECYHVRYQRIQSARIAKRFLDDKSFYGGILHVCYAPEHESIEETRQKLLQRTKDVMNRLNPTSRSLQQGNTNKNENLAMPETNTSAITNNSALYMVNNDQTSWNGQQTESYWNNANSQNNPEFQQQISENVHLDSNTSSYTDDYANQPDEQINQTAVKSQQEPAYSWTNPKHSKKSAFEWHIKGNMQHKTDLSSHVSDSKNHSQKTDQTVVNDIDELKNTDKTTSTLKQTPDYYWKDPNTESKVSFKLQNKKRSGKFIPRQVIKKRKLEHT